MPPPLQTWNTGPLLSDSCGYIVLDHAASAPRIILAFRGTYSLANTIIDLSTVPQEYVPYPSDPPSGSGSHAKCANCTVHSGFLRSWRHTRRLVLPALEKLREEYPDYAVELVGHSMGGAVAALAGLELQGEGVRVTTFGEPKIGNKGLSDYIDAKFNLRGKDVEGTRFTRVTHVDDPVPLLPLEEWGYRPHAGEVYIGKPDLVPQPGDLRLCDGDEDVKCVAGNAAVNPVQLLFAHRDYFWRLGLCVPGGDPSNWQAPGLEELTG